MSGVRHVVLAKPGDILVIGNAGQAATEDFESLSQLVSELGIKVVVFEWDIDMRAVSSGGDG